VPEPAPQLMPQSKIRDPKQTDGSFCPERGIVLRATTATIEASCPVAKTDTDGFLAFWHGDIATTESRPWLVMERSPRPGAACFRGRGGTYKTFTAIEPASAVSGTPIFDSDMIALAAIDTVVVTAGFKKSGDEDDAVLGAQMIEAMKKISRETRAFVLGADHFGKTAETGTRHVSAQENVQPLDR
jgi:hypothetical protein